MQAVYFLDEKQRQIPILEVPRHNFILSNTLGPAPERSFDKFAKTRLEREKMDFVFALFSLDNKMKGRCIFATTTTTATTATAATKTPKQIEMHRQDLTKVN
jgi:hypothetical protein